MSIVEIVVAGIALAMDAFAVSICKGLSMKKMDYKKIIIIGLYFGIFQAIMPLIGYLLGSSFSGFIESIDHWIAFGLLSLIGFNMIKEAIGDKNNSNNDSVSFKVMIPLAVATSIDALAVGITFAFLKVNIIISILIIGIITFLICIIGVFIGNKFGNKYEKKSRVVGGIVLIIIGIKILLEHLGLI